MQGNLDPMKTTAAQGVLMMLVALAIYKVTVR
jgi:hypothetical protein